MSAPVIRKKLIEVSLPLDAINAEASRRKQKSPKGYPTNIHKWWAQIPVAAARGVLFAQLVDDPSAWPDRFPTERAIRTERDRLHRLIEQLVPWEANSNDTILGQARWEIARSLAWARGEDPPPVEDGRAVLAYLAAHAPPIYDPFCGGGSIPLEAQRLGLRSIASDLNPIAVLITRALVEIPPKYAGLPPINPPSRAKVAQGGMWRGRDAQGLAEDVRYYGAWMREEAFRRIGHLYPQAELPDGSKATSIAWIWARTVRSPNPAARGAMVPLVSSFLISSKPGREIWLEPEVDAAAGIYLFRIRTEGTTAEIEAAKRGTKRGNGSFECLLTGSSFGYAYIDSEANAGRLGATLLAIVAEGKRGRLYLPATRDMEQVARSASPTFKPNQPTRGTFASNAQGRAYGFKTFGDYFTPRQLLALTTFADLVAEVRLRIAIDAASADLASKTRPCAENIIKPQEYADAVATYLAIVVSRVIHYNCALCHWLPKDNAIAMGLPQQAISMSWDFAEGNPFGSSSSEFFQCLKNIVDCLEAPSGKIGAAVFQKPAQDAGPFSVPPVVSTDPPYYANVVYSDLSDFFYCWLRRMLASIYPSEYATLTVPKVEELVANPYRHGRDNADSFFLRGMQLAISRLAEQASESQPMTLYYAYNQSEKVETGKIPSGWASFLQALHDAGICIDGTWPLRTQNAGRLVAQGSNALASAIILACRRRSSTAATATRNQFLAALRAELPDAIRTMQQEALAPVDLQQAAIGPGIAVFTRYARVLESDDSTMLVRTALALINVELDDVLAEQEGEFDPVTRFAITWFSTFGFEEQLFGEAQSLARARAIGTDSLVHQHVLSARAGRARLLRRGDLPRIVALDAPHWVQAHALINALLEQGESAAATLLARLGPAGEACRDLAYRLFQIAIDERRKLLTEATEYNALVVAWPDLQRLAGEIPQAPAQGDFLAAV